MVLGPKGAEGVSLLSPFDTQNCIPGKNQAEGCFEQENHHFPKLEGGFNHSKID